MSSGNKTIIYFHNLSNFDGFFILKNLLILEENINKINYEIRNNQIVKLKIDNIIFLDSYKIIPESLDIIAEKLLKKSKIKINIEKLWKNLNLNKKKYKSIW